MTVEAAITQGLKVCGELLVKEAKANINGYGSNRHGGGLVDSIDYEVEDNELTVGTNLEYAIYYEMGTGPYAVNGNGKEAPWYIPIGYGKDEITPETVKFYGFKTTKDEETGMEWALCFGSKPYPFLGPALNDNKEKLVEIVGKKVAEALADD